MPLKKLERRRQPQVAIQSVRDALAEINWAVKEIASHCFLSPSGVTVNESFGYELSIPRSNASIKKLWIGYLSGRGHITGFLWRFGRGHITGFLLGDLLGIKSIMIEI